MWRQGEVTRPGSAAEPTAAHGFRPSLPHLRHRAGGCFSPGSAFRSDRPGPVLCIHIAVGNSPISRPFLWESVRQGRSWRGDPMAGGAGASRPRTRAEAWGRG